MAAEKKGSRTFKGTKFGRRALIGHPRFAIPNVGGPSSSVSTATSTFSDRTDRKGRAVTDVAIYPTIRAIGGSSVRLKGKDAVELALKSGDFVRVRGGTTKKEIAKAQTKADKKSREFSKKLGKRQ